MSIEITPEEANRRYFVCRVCGHVEEHDMRDVTAWKCPSEEHPPTRLRALFANRLMP
jgi:rubrerythrin